ncbi:MAG: MOSC domain-containing protein [Hyphomicrobiales bacterium]|nr:MOSC domain-containing protein [Hyphomicrobiales bacterium]
MSTGPDGVPGRVAGLWRYPVSSLAGERLDKIAVGADGFVGDRQFGLVDNSTGEIAKPDANKKWHGLPGIAARLSENGSLEVRAPGGDWLAAPGEAADRAASALLDFDAAILPFEAGTRLPAPRYKKAPVHLLTTASLAELKALHPEGNPDPRRFRPNILVEMPQVAGHFPETEWLGRKLAIGDVELAVTDPCRRCGFTIIAQEGFENDPDILRTLVRKNAHNLGVYCEVTRPGEIRSGATVRFVD